MIKIIIIIDYDRIDLKNYILELTLLISLIYDKKAHSSIHNMECSKGLKSGIIAITLLVDAISIIATTTTATSVQAVVEDDGEFVPKANPYCDTQTGKAALQAGLSCHDRQDYNEGGPYDGMATCNDGTHEADYKDCKDASESDNYITS